MKPAGEKHGGSDVARLLRSHGIRLTGRLGQHLLVDRDLLAQTAAATGAGPGGVVIEVGSGIANLTAALARTGADVRAIELDESFRPVHAEFRAAEPMLSTRVEFIYADALDFDYAAASREAAAAGKTLFIAGNIPYQITSPLVMNILESGADFATMTFMMQLEVAERLAARPGSKKNGGISIKVQYFCDVEAVMDVPRHAFLPPPEVESRVLRFRRKPGELVEGERERFFAFVDAAFGQRRKVMPNAVAGAGIGITKEQAAAALTAAGFSPSARAEDFGLAEFLRIFRALG